MRNTAIVVDDHPMCRQATIMALQAADPDIDILEAGSLAEARQHAAAARLMTLDLHLPDTRGISGLAELKRDFPDLDVLVISGATNPQIEHQVAMTGAQGFLSKATKITEMVQAMRTMLEAGTWFSADLDRGLPPESEFARLSSLTPAQARVLRAMEDGRLNKQIAYDLEMSEITVKAHVKAILKKLGVPNRTQAILLLRRVEA